MIRIHTNRKTIAAFALSLVTGAACGRTGGDVADSGEEGQLPPPAAALSGTAAIGMERRLAALEADLTRVLEDQLGDESEPYLLRAEASTDRLLEEQPEFAWLASGYLVEARLRQIQALADRTVAELRRGVAKELVLEDVAALRTAVRDLREHLSNAASSDVPPSLDSLLVAYANDRTGLGGVPATSGGGSSDTAAVAAEPEPVEPEPQVAPEGGLLGEPIQP